MTESKINSDYRIMLLNVDVEPSSVAPIMMEILRINELDDKEEEEKKDYKREPIKIYIDSYGGCVKDMWALVHCIKTSKTPVYTYCTSNASSSAAFILIAGHKRFAYTYSEVMIHPFSGGSYGQYKDLVENAEVLERRMDKLWNYIVQNTKIPRETLDSLADHRRDWYIFAQEALELGIVDEVIDSE